MRPCGKLFWNANGLITKVTCRREQISFATDHKLVARAVIEKACCDKCGKLKLVGVAVARCDICATDLCSDCVGTHAGVNNQSPCCAKLFEGTMADSCCNECVHGTWYMGRNESMKLSHF
eukprot:TRINITY_DN29509_c0_g1_i1.p1 TRINITY_DN29509_c0_g1~~TRINITY_DN29509_c0_g1_i1.p1  ORF type:complete len:120 (-),score=16.84 TRINITY_DN29509_c0_g1_i1:30-389(-)